MRQHLKLVSIQYRIEETYVKVGMSGSIFTDTVDSHDQTIEFLLSAKRDLDAAKRFFKKMMRAAHADCHSPSAWTSTPLIWRHSSFQ